ncbi:integrase catalytic domain-containing protein [Trichonephila clavipes]|nr:integrase catalytic domain-containing protein [Trichonephila clavipes]
MEAAGMDLRKWITNDANLMEQWKKENFNVHSVHETVSLGANGTKVLGLSWNTNEDYLTTDTKSLLEFVSLDKNTKRFILQAVGKIFDPLGLISPFTVRMKCLLQDLWKEIQWDDPLPTHIEKEWKKWCEELPHLRNLKIPRLVLDSTLLEDDVELHSFCDASKKAYGAAIYLRTKSRNGISVKLVTSKSRVAPLNCVTLPRLELLGALVAARLASKGNKTRWKQFVANRVNEITSLTDPHSWYHCAGKENPADFLSRGLSADCLVSNSRWWTGAEFLSDSEFPKNFQQVVPELDYLTEHEKETVVQERKKLSEADKNGEGIVRVGGRLENASVPYLHKHPAILPKGSKLSKLYFNSLHTRLFHVGPQGLLNAVRQKFWPLSGRSIARKTVHQCVTCFKSRPILSSQIMAKYFVSENIDWKFIPPKSPHFGGLWEAGVKSVKHHLKRTIENLHFTFEEFETFMIQVEGILNSRPLTPLSSDADNFDVLTPGHFLIGRPITSIPEPNLIDVNENRLSRWEKITKVVQRTWKKLKSDYLNTLQARSKWITEKNDLMIGQMVLIKEDFLPINTWPLGRILEVYHGSDGKVRVVKVKTQSGEFKRSISKIAVLPIDTK